MNTPRDFTIIAFLALAPIASACGDPCLPTFTADTLLIAPVLVDCEAITSSTSPSTGGGTSTITGTSTDASTTGADECIAPLPAPTCAAVPDAGTAWGPCIIGGVGCSDGSKCHVSQLGSVCMPSCDVAAGCSCDAGVCLGGVCTEDGTCGAQTCTASGEPCPLPGQVCDFNGGAPLCVYPPK